MQIVIDMPKDVYEEIMAHNRELRESGKSSYYLEGLIQKGTPLPEGHGKIVDIDKLIDSKCNECGHLRGVSCTIPCYEVRRMLDAQTLIGADIESEESDIW